MYSIQPSHTGSYDLFLKNPEKRMKGKRTIGITADTDFASKIALPMKRPKEEPFRAIKMYVK